MAEEISGPGTTAYHFHYDGNGNVTEITDASGNQVERGAFDPSTWAGGPGLSGLRERNRAALDPTRSRIDPEGVMGVRSRVAGGVPMAAPPGTVGRRAPVNMNGTRVDVTIQSQGPLDTDGIVRELRPRMPLLLQEVLQDAYDRAEGELE
jgi:YD repeat-containing protein